MYALSVILRILGSFAISVGLVNLVTWALYPGNELLTGNLPSLPSFISGVCVGLLAIAFMWLSQE